MSKLAIGLGVLVLGSGASLTGAYALGAFDPDYELPKKFDEEKKGFKQKVLDEGCVQGLFPGVRNGSASEISNDNEVTELTNNAEGCLVVNWDKGPGTTGKGKGTFRFLGAMKSGKKGFIVFASGDTSSESQKMNFKATTYIVDSTSEPGKVTKKKEETDKKVDKPLNFGTNVGSMNSTKQSYWGLTDDSGWNNSENLDALPTDKTESYFRGYGTGKEEKNKSEPSSWSSSWAAGWTAVFTDSPLKIADKVNSLKGTWEKSVIYSTVAT